MTDPDDRAGFEAAAAAPPFERNVQRFPDNGTSAWPGNYRDINVDFAWQMWRARGGEVERLRRDCAEAYQVVAAALYNPKPPLYDTDDVLRVLDNLQAASNGERRPHEDLLPWPRARFK